MDQPIKPASSNCILLLEYVIREADNKLLAKGKTMQTFVDKDSFRIINLRKIHPNIWAKLDGLSK